MATPLDSAQPTLGGLMALLASLRGGRMASSLAPLRRLFAFARTCNDPSGVCHWRANRCSIKRRRQ